MKLGSILNFLFQSFFVNREDSGNTGRNIKLQSTCFCCHLFMIAN